MPARAKTRSARPAALAERIVDAAVARGENLGWDRVRLSDVARDLKVPTAAVLDHFRDLDAVADAWFGRALAAMLAAGERARARPPRERVEALMLAWFDALRAHRPVTAEMLKTKLYLSHPHHWVPMIFSLSRTIQWLRDAAGFEAQGRRRQIEEIGLSALFLATLALWCRDASPNQERTRAFLSRTLDAADRGLARLYGGTGT
jgi:AcrR family transcriptional regulator